MYVYIYVCICSYCQAYTTDPKDTKHRVLKFFLGSYIEICAREAKIFRNTVDVTKCTYYVN